MPAESISKKSDENMESKIKKKVKLFFKSAKNANNINDILQLAEVRFKGVKYSNRCVNPSLSPRQIHFTISLPTHKPTNLQRNKLFNLENFVK